MLLKLNAVVVKVLRYDNFSRNKIQLAIIWYKAYINFRKKKIEILAEYYNKGHVSHLIA